MRRRFISDTSQPLITKSKHYISEGHCKNNKKNVYVKNNPHEQPNYEDIDAFHETMLLNIMMKVVAKPPGLS